MPTPQGSAGTSPRQLISPRERFYYALMVVVSLVVYGGLLLLAVSKPEIGASMLVYALLIPILGILAHGIALGRVRGNAVRVSEKQFPQLHKMAVAHARKLGLKQVPAIYVMQSGGLLNAFATRFLGRDFVIILSDVLELALEQAKPRSALLWGTSWLTSGAGISSSGGSQLQAV